jgi:phosphatidylserine/phosphatidylglycerophosphate/cardiolipin synthase-like enzyme
MPKLTDYELEQIAVIPAGPCELVVNEGHFTRVIRGGMARAQVSLDIMTADFKAMLVPLGRGKASGGRRKAESVVQLFRRLAERGVEIRILHAGTPSGPALVELKRALLPAKGRRGKGISTIINEDGQARLANLTVRRCPRLHAKAVIIDARAMYLGSANLTGAGLGAKGAEKRNFEMGIWTESPAMIESVSDQFNRLWEGHCCAKCRRKDVCPVPLEEPRL